MAHQVDTIDFRRHLDRSFWSATFVLGVISLVLMVLIVAWPINDSLTVASNTALLIDPIFKFMLIVAAPIFVYVNGYIVYFARRYKHRAHEPADAVGIPLHGVTKLEIWWTVIPTILMIALGIWSAIVLFDLYRPQPGALNIESIGHQWSFEFRYPGMKKSFYGNPYLPVNRPVTLNITSADVIHSFWVPDFRLKLDMVPGMVQQLHFTPDKIGDYPVICTEYCGVGHADMHTVMHVVSQADYGAWLAKMQQSQVAAAATGPNLAAGVPDKGKALFAEKCAVCHNVAPFDQKKVGPGLKDVFNDPQHPNLVDGARATPANVAHILENGFSGSIGVMPNAQANGLTSDDIANLVAFLKSQSK